MASNALAYELNVSPRTSIDSHDSIQKHHDLESPSTATTHENDRPAATLTPSIRLLFSLLSRKHRLFLLFPAILSSLVAGGIAPFMTYVVGKAFDAFAQYQTSFSKHELLKGVGIASLELVALAVASLALGSLTSFLWIWTGEVNVLALRKRVYQAVTNKEIVWFDLNMGTADDSQDSIGAGGLMAKFSRDTDDVRSATSLASGLLIQHLTTTLASLLLAFHRSWSLTLVVLSAVPLLTILQSISQAFATPLLAAERGQTGVAATIVDRAVAAISTVKAFNAQPLEANRAKDSFDKLERAAGKLNTLWGLTSGSAQFVMMAMFVQGFWFGSKLVRDGKISPGDVMAVFWACLIATSNLQMCIPRWITLAKGKFAMVELMGLVVDSAAPLPPQNQYPPSSPNHRRSHSRTLRKITPNRCMGELALHNLTFNYPSRSTSEPVLSDVSLFLPAHELTFIVGSSGSGKSTVAQLLLGMYETKHGQVTIDEQDIKFLEETWVRENVMGVGQAVGGGGCVILEGKSVFENVAAAVAASGRQVSREEVEEACRAALLHEFVRDLPEGYDTILGGTSGMQLSGGQRQRLAMARARVRNPPVLILDEATSALDPTSRLLVFSALKCWRHKKTTVVITHDLSQIESGDFVYVLKSGRVVEQGFRYDLEIGEGGEGEFRRMAEVQKEVGGFVEETVEEVEEVHEMELEEEAEEEEEFTSGLPSKLKHQSLAIRPLTFGNWMFEVIAELTGTSKHPPLLAVPEPVHTVSSKRDTYRFSRFPPVDQFNTPPVPALPTQHQRKRRPSSLMIPSSPIVPRAVYEMPSSPGGGRRYSLPPMTASSATFTIVNRSTCMTDDEWEKVEEDEFDKQKTAMTKSGVLVHARREKRGERRGLGGVKVVENKTDEQEETKEHAVGTPSFWAISRSIWPTIPSKPLLFLGLVLCTISGLVTPVFSFLLSRLLFEVSIGATRVNIINRFGVIVLSVAALDGIFLGSKFAVMESCGMRWVTTLRQRAFKRVLSQDKSFFDCTDNAPSQIVQTLVKDGDDARNLVGVVWGQCFVVLTMLSVGLIWALVRGWQLTLAGFAIAPVFAGVMALQTRWVAEAEVRNKRAREDVAKGYYDAVVHVRGIRCVGGSFEGAFREKFELAAERALKTGVRGALVEGCTYGVASGLIYAAEAMLFYVGAVLISKELFTYLQMVEVLNLVVFTVTIGSQLMAFTEKIAKSVQATADLTKLSDLPSQTNESQGVFTPNLEGSIQFNNVQFAYPERPEIPVLKDVNLEITDGECVAIVGSSGSGKSTIASLLQRLYEPVSGSITIGHTDVRAIEISHLRNGVSVVSQQPNLFDASIAENIRYGNTAISDVDIRTAAKAANVHQFIMELPQGYDTVVGENASLISGGQAQRIQIARALARPGARILILDECTSALDPENEAAVMETIRSVKKGRTTVMVTHKVEVMRMCDRIVVVGDGVVQEQGTYEDLMERKGVFATLASGGEWVGA